MNHLQLMGVIACGAVLTGCETTGTAGRGNQETKRLAAIQAEQERERAEAAEVDEARRNLWNAQHDILTRDGNAASHYY